MSLAARQEMIPLDRRVAMVTTTCLEPTLVSTSGYEREAPDCMAAVARMALASIALSSSERSLLIHVRIMDR